MNTETSITSGVALEMRNLHNTSADAGRESVNHSELHNHTKHDSQIKVKCPQSFTTEENVIQDHRPTSQLGDNNGPSSEATDNSERFPGHEAGPTAASIEAWNEAMPEARDKSDNAAIWKTYLTRADEVDAVLIDKWSKSIDVFLLFTGLFSAILSAFIVVSWSNLQSDTAQATVDGLVAVSQQLVLLSAGQPISPATSYQPPPFVAPWSALVVNFLWFLSLFISLHAAILTMLMKEWLSMYDDDKEVQPLLRVQQRQLRYDGLYTWMVPWIARALPILIHIAVMLFLTGLTVFVRSASLALSWMMTALLVGGIILWVSSAIIPLIRPDCPYKSPLYAGLRDMRLLSLSVTPFVVRNISRTFGPSSMNATDLEVGGSSPEGFESRERAYIRRTAVKLQAGALAWLCTCPDPAVQEAALLVLSWWRMPRRLWKTFRQDVGNAANSVVKAYLSPPTLESPLEDRVEKPDKMKLEELEKLALISILVPDHVVVDRWPLQELVESETSSPYRRSLAESLRFNLCSKAGMALIPMESKPVFEACSRLEVIWSADSVQSPIDSSASLARHPLSELSAIALCGTQVHLPQGLLFQYACALGFALQVEEPDCSMAHNQWISRYPTGGDGRHTARILLACIRRLYSSNPFPPRWEEQYTSHVSINILKHMAGQQECVTGYQGDSNSTLRAVTSEPWGMARFSPGRNAEVTSSLVAALLDGTSCLSPESFASVVRYTLEYHQNSAVLAALENCLWRSASSVSSWLSHSSLWASRLIETDMEQLLSNVTKSTVALCFPALLMSYVALQGDQRERSAELLTSMQWLDCFYKYGLDYFSPPPENRLRDRDYDLVLGVLQRVLEILLRLHPANVMLSDLVQAFCRREGRVIEGWRGAEQDRHTGSLQTDERNDAACCIPPEAG